LSYADCQPSTSTHTHTQTHTHTHQTSPGVRPFAPLFVAESCRGMEVLCGLFDAVSCVGQAVRHLLQHQGNCWACLPTSLSALQSDTWTGGTLMRSSNLWTLPPCGIIQLEWAPLNEADNWAFQAPARHQAVPPELQRHHAFVCTSSWSGRRRQLV
jgi:hypothetical protein